MSDEDVLRELDKEIQKKKTFKQKVEENKIKGLVKIIKNKKYKRESTPQRILKKIKPTKYKISKIKYRDEELERLRRMKQLREWAEQKRKLQREEKKYLKKKNKQKFFV